MSHSCLSILSTRETVLASSTRREHRNGHPDGHGRARLLQAIQDEIDMRCMMRQDACLAAGVPPGSLDDSSLTTASLRDVLAVLKRLPIS